MRKVILAPFVGLLMLGGLLGTASTASANSASIPEPVGGTIGLTVDDVQYSDDGDCVDAPVAVDVDVPDDYAYANFEYTSTYDGPTSWADEISGDEAWSGTYYHSFTVCPEYDSPGTYQGYLSATFYDEYYNAITTAHATDSFRVSAYTPPDTVAPVLSDFDFTPKSVNVNSGAKAVTVTAHLTDDTGARAPEMRISSDSTTQTTGTDAMTLVSGTTQDGTWQRTVTIPASAATGLWTVELDPLTDTLANDDSTFHNHPSKLTVANNPPAPVTHTTTLSTNKIKTGAHGWTIRTNVKYDGHAWAGHKVTLQRKYSGAWHYVKSVWTNAYGNAPLSVTPPRGAAKPYRAVSAAGTGVGARVSPTYWLKRR